MVSARPMAPIASPVALRLRRMSGRGAARTRAVAPARKAERPSGPIRAQSATVKIVTAMTTSAAPAPSSRRAAVRPDISGRRVTGGVAGSRAGTSGA